MRPAHLILLPALCLVCLNGHSETNGEEDPNPPKKVITIDFMDPNRLDTLKKDIKMKKIKIVDGDSVVFHLNGLNLNIYDVKIKPLKVVGEHSYGQALRLLMDFASSPSIGNALGVGQTGTSTEPATTYIPDITRSAIQKTDSDISKRLAKEFLDCYRSFLSRIEVFNGDIRMLTNGLAPLIDKDITSEKALHNKIKNNIDTAIAASKSTKLLPLDWDKFQENLVQNWIEHSEAIEASFLQMTMAFEQFQDKKVVVTPDIRLRYVDATEKYRKIVIAGEGEGAFKNVIKALREAKDISFSHDIEPLRAQGMGLKLVVSRAYTEAYTKNAEPIIDGIPDETYEFPVYPAASASTWSRSASPQQVSVSVGYGYVGRGFDSKLSTTAPMIMVSGLSRGGSASAWRGPSVGLAFNGGPALLLGYSWMIGNDTRLGLTPGIVLGKMNYLLPDDPSKRFSYGGFLALTISLPSLKD